MRWIINIVLFFMFCGLSAQSLNFNNDSLYYPKTLILKLNKSAKNLQFSNGINSEQFNYYLNKILVSEFIRVFPYHSSPDSPINESGDSLVDLSLFYQLKYQADIHENILINKLKLIGIFEYVERRPINSLLFTPNDSYLGSQYYPGKVKAFDAWDIEEGDSNIVIGIVDSGTDLFGEDLKGGIKLNKLDTIDGIDNDNDGYIDNYRGWDLGQDDNNPTSFNDHHGCFTTGISSARTNNGAGIAGLGYKTMYLPVKVSDLIGYLNKDYEGIVYAADHRASIINCSWGGQVISRFGQDIVNYATFNQNALVVCAAGNNGNNLHVYPASFENAISCAATDSLDQYWNQTSFGTTVDISSPGASIFSTWTYNGYFASSGTSFSAPGVSAAAALLKSHYPLLSALQLGEQIRVSADNIDTVSLNQPIAGFLGSGRLNMYNALTDTMKPSIRFRNRIIDAKSTMPGDTFRFSGEFENLLNISTPALNVTLSSSTPYLTIINPYRALGQINTLSMVDNYGSPFLFKISPNTPSGTIADIKFTYKDTNYSGFEYFRFVVNPNFMTIDTNQIETTISSDGTVGFSDFTMANGRGLYYKNSVNILSWSGLVVGNSSGKVSSNIYGDAGFDQDFISTSTIAKINPPLLGDDYIASSFNDNGANFTKLNISVNQKSYAYESKPDDAIFLQYTIKNNGVNALSTLYIGFYADFDIGVSYKNYGNADTNLNLAYISNNTQSLYGGIMVLDSLPMHIYQIDNDGVNNSVNLYDGFIDYEKYATLTNSRLTSGTSNPAGNDVSSMISVGPFNLLPGDSQTVTFAILASDHLSSLKHTAQQAFDAFYNVAGIQKNIVKNNIHVYPNPFDEHITIETEKVESQSGIFELFNQAGQRILSKTIKITSQRSKIELPELPAGRYIYQLKIGDKTYSNNLLKL